MKATVPLSDLRRVVGIAARAASGMSGAIHSGVHLALDDTGTITATGTDMETRAAATCGVTDGDPGVVVIPAKRLVSVLGAIGGEDTTLTTEGADVSLTAGRSCVTLRTLDLEQWPRFAAVEGEPCRLDPETWSALARVVVAASTDDARPSITGVHLRFGYAAATDTGRLHVTPIPEALDTYLPVRAVREALRLGDEATVTTGANETRFDMEGGTIWTRSMADDPPDWRRPIDIVRKNPHAVEFDADEMRGALGLALAATNSGVVALDIGPEGIGVRAADADVGDSDDHVDASVSGLSETAAFGLDPEFLADALDAVAPDGGPVTMTVADPRRAVYLAGSGVEVAIMVVFL